LEIFLKGETVYQLAYTTAVWKKEIVCCVLACSQSDGSNLRE